ncbi:MAG: hypothetical protein ACE5HG_01795 [Candidatus Bathyarchaeia archaeon]
MTTQMKAWQSILARGVKAKLKNRKIPVGIGIPADMLKRIDKERGDIPRSVYVTKLLQQALKEKAS